MAERRITTADRAFIDGMAYLCHATALDQDTYGLVFEGVRDLLPHVSRDHVRIGALAEVADDMVREAGGRAGHARIVRIRVHLAAAQRALADIAKHRFAAGWDQFWRDRGTRPPGAPEPLPLAAEAS